MVRKDGNDVSDDKSPICGLCGYGACVCRQPWETKPVPDGYNQASDDTSEVASTTSRRREISILTIFESSWPNIPCPDKFVLNDLALITSKSYNHMDMYFYIDTKTKRLYVKHEFKNQELEDQWCEITFRRIPTYS